MLKALPTAISGLPGSSSVHEMVARIQVRVPRAGRIAGFWKYSGYFRERGSHPGGGRACAALECGSLLPLWREPACWRRLRFRAVDPASKLGEESGSKLPHSKAAHTECNTELQIRNQTVLGNRPDKHNGTLGCRNAASNFDGYGKRLGG